MENRIQGKPYLTFFIALTVILVMFSGTGVAFVSKSQGTTFIEDLTGERWDVTQAESIGFKPEKFQYGIGKNAFTPLDDSALHDEPPSFFRNPRVIGVTDGSEAKAYSVPKLRYHEIANTQIGEKPIAAGY